MAPSRSRCVRRLSLNHFFLFTEGTENTEEDDVPPAATRDSCCLPGMFVLLAVWLNRVETNRGCPFQEELPQPDGCALPIRLDAPCVLTGSARWYEKWQQHATSSDTSIAELSRTFVAVGVEAVRFCCEFRCPRENCHHTHNYFQSNICPQGTSGFEKTHF